MKSIRTKTVVLAAAAALIIAIRNTTQNSTKARDEDFMEY